MSTQAFDVAVIGGGIVGVATARALMQAKPGLKLVLLEAEDRLAAHQTGNNSGVIHSGLYYKPGSMKARTCTEGREEMYRFCAENGIAHEKCGKIVVATAPDEIPRLDALEEKGRANGLEGLRRLKSGGIKDIEPHIAGIDGLWVPQTGIVDYSAVVETMAKQVREAGGEVRVAHRVTAMKRDGGGLVLETPRGEVQAKNLVNCAGLQCDRVARMCGVEPNVKIVPFRGEYHNLSDHAAALVHNLVYPVPDPAFPFLGVHFTRLVHGGMEAGPNAVLAFRREGYKKNSFSLRDTVETFTYSGALRLFAKHWRMGLGEFHRSFSKQASLKALQRLCPELVMDSLLPGGAGVRAQALAPDGRLVDDFHIVEARRMIHVLNAPSPAATASIAIGRAIAEKVLKRFFEQSK